MTERFWMEPEIWFVKKYLRLKEHSSNFVGEATKRGRLFTQTKPAFCQQRNVYKFSFCPMRPADTFCYHSKEDLRLLKFIVKFNAPLLSKIMQRTIWLLFGFFLKYIRWQ